jgi:purine-binding chemotaxis protein CheW
MRRAFDDAFRRAREERADTSEALIAIGVGGLPFAFRMRDVSALEVDKRIALLHGGPPGLLGITQMRGTLVPVYGLAGLVGGRDGSRRSSATFRSAWRSARSRRTSAHRARRSSA